MKYTFAGVIGSEGELTGDGRLITENALRFETPLPLMFVRESSGGHTGAVTVGTFRALERRGNDIWAEGDFLDVDAEAMPELAEDVATAVLLVSSGAAPGVSMDLSEVTAELRVAQHLLEASEAEELEIDEDGRVTLFKMDPNDEVMVFTDAEIRGATLVSIPAFKNAKLNVYDENGELAVLVRDELTEFQDANVDPNPADCACLTAAAPRQSDHTKFAPQELPGPTPLYVTPEGQVLGHIALWETCHVGFPGTCTSPPRDPNGYAAFHQSRIQTDAGPVRVGVLTVGGGHADARLGARAAMEHYDNVGTAWAYVHAYEDDHGIAVAGVLAQDLDDAVLATALAHPISGDWRNLGSGLELVAACSVNTPGFPVLAASGGVQTSLVASSAPLGMASADEAAFDLDALADTIISKMEKRELDKELNAEAKRLALEVAAIEADALYADVHK